MAQLPPFQVGKKRKPSLVAFAFLGALAQSCRGCGNRPARREPPLSREAFCGSKLKEGTLPKKKKKKTHTQTHTHRHKKQAQKEPNCTAPDTPSWSPYWSQLSLIGIEGWAWHHEDIVISEAFDIDFTNRLLGARTLRNKYNPAWATHNAV